ncbi:MAG: chitobiase/beta-hexosaminidase C-terminal domain-containing protein, partial [Bacteroidales bacterium]|nr:chitobiase/beta-hexosaminidase C-terminal domain-containing protein [Bacteroidales bacterium]
MKQFNFLKVALMSLVLLFAFCVHGYAQTVVFSENFTMFSGGSSGSGAGSADRGTSLDSYTQMPGWLGTKVYEAGGSIKMGTTSVAGYIQTPAIDLSEDNGVFVISFKSMAWSGDSTYFYMHVMNADTITETITVQNLGNSADYEWDEYEFNLTTGDSATKIKFEAVAGSKSRFFLDDLEISQILPAPPAATPVFTPASMVCYAPQTVTIACGTENAIIYYTTNHTTPDSITGTLYTAPFAVSSTTEVKAIAYKEGMKESTIATATYTFPIEVASIAAFKNAGATATSGTVFKITGDATFVYQNGINIFVQDETGGLLIYNSSNADVPEYAEGDVISGIYGTYAVYNGLQEMVPTQDLPESTENDGAITIPTVTVAQIKANYNTYEAKLVNIVYAVFEEGTFTASSATNINFAQYGTEEMICRNYFRTLTNEIEEGDIKEVTGFVLKYNDDIQLAPRTNTDIVPYTIPVVATPVIDLPSGNYLRDTLAVITCVTESATLYYTLDNTEPTIASSIYTAPVPIFGNQTLKAMAVKLGYNNSDVATATYTFPAYAEVPYTNSFEDEEVNNWVIVNGAAANKWMVGQAQGFDNNKLFVSSTNGTTNKYNATSAATVHAYRTISVPANGAYLTFDYRLGGNANDYLAVSLLEEGTAVTAGTLPTGAVALTGNNEWQEYLALLEEGTYRLVFTWVNDNSGENQFPAAIDNISLQNVLCVKPSNLVVEFVDGNTSDEAKANVSWTAANGQNSWIVEYGEVGKATVYTKNVSGTPEVELSPLNRYSTYEISVKANCGEEQSLAETQIINVPCSNLNSGEMQTAESTSTGNQYLPVGYSYYNYGYSQQIIDAGTLPKGSLKSISFYCTQIPKPAGKLGAMKIWLGMTDKSSFASTTDFVNPTEMTLVLEMGASEIWDLPSTGWYTLIFDTEFFYDGV